MAKVVVAIKPTTSTCASSVTRYISQSKRDQQKEHLEDKEARPLFSNNLDGLTHQQADELLAEAQGWFPQSNEVIHLIISPEEGSFEGLGATFEQQIAAFKDIIRDVSRQIENEVNFDELRWIAGIHLNTDLPHAHMAISRHGLDKQTQELRHIDHLPKTLLPHNERTTDGEKKFNPGLIAQTVSNGIELSREKFQRASPPLRTVNTDH
jgi:hypothetical protein